LCGKEQTTTELSRNLDILPVRRIHAFEYRDLSPLSAKELHSSERKEDTRFQGRNGSVKFAFFIEPS